MAEKFILIDGKLIEAFVYEGEDLGIEYHDGTVLSIPNDKLYLVLREAQLPDGESCHVVLRKSPLTRLDVVIVPEKKESHEQATN